MSLISQSDPALKGSTTVSVDKISTVKQDILARRAQDAVLRALELGGRGAWNASLGEEM